jgi:hypothetical protein
MHNGTGTWQLLVKGTLALTVIDTPFETSNLNVANGNVVFSSSSKYSFYVNANSTPAGGDQLTVSNGNVTINAGATHVVNAAGAPALGITFPDPIVVTGTDMAITGLFLRTAEQGSGQARTIRRR